MSESRRLHSGRSFSQASLFDDDAAQHVVEQFRDDLAAAVRQQKPLPRIADYLDRVPEDRREQLVQELAAAVLFGNVDHEMTIRLHDLIAGLPRELAQVVSDVYEYSGETGKTGKGALDHTPSSPTRDESLLQNPTGAFGTSAVATGQSHMGQTVRIGELQRVHYPCFKIYSGTPLTGGAPVEVAVLQLSRPPLAELAEALKSELARLAQAGDSHLQPAREIAIEGNRVALVSPLVELQPLKRWKHAQRPTWAEMASAMAKVAEKLAELHQRGLVHGLVNSATVGITRASQPMLRDVFPPSIHRLAAETDGELIPELFHFLPPERLRGSRTLPEPADDIYALGIVLYELCTGAPPFPVHSLQQYRKLVSDKEAPPLRVRNPKVPRELEAICLRCLEIDSSRRFQTAMELVRELECFAESASRSATTTPLPQRVSDSAATVELDGLDTAPESSRSQLESSWASVLTQPGRSLGSVFTIFFLVATVVATVGYFVGRSGHATPVAVPGNIEDDRPQITPPPGRAERMQRLTARPLVTPPADTPFIIEVENNGAGLRVTAPEYPPRFLTVHAYVDPQASYEFETTFVQPEVYGGFGIVFGAERNANGDYELHSLDIDSVLGQRFVRVIRYLVTPRGHVPSTHVYSRVDLPGEMTEVRLGVRLQNGHLAEFLVNGKPIPKLIEDFVIQRQLMKASDSYLGKTGFRFHATDVHVRNVRINGEHYGFELARE